MKAIILFGIAATVLCLLLVLVIDMYLRRREPRRDEPECIACRIGVPCRDGWHYDQDGMRLHRCVENRGFEDPRRWVNATPRVFHAKDAE